MKKDLLQIVSEMYSVPTQTYYHISPSSNRRSILKNGLIPQIGNNSESLGEIEDGIYLFPSMDDLENALSNWLGELYDDDEIELDIFEVTLPENFPLESDVEYEVRSLTQIPPKYISYRESV